MTPARFLDVKSLLTVDFSALLELASQIVLSTAALIVGKTQIMLASGNYLQPRRLSSGILKKPLTFHSNLLSLEEAG